MQSRTCLYLREIKKITLSNTPSVGGVDKLPSNTKKSTANPDSVFSCLPLRIVCRKKILETDYRGEKRSRLTTLQSPSDKLILSEQDSQKSLQHQICKHKGMVMKCFKVYVSSEIHPRFYTEPAKKQVRTRLILFLFLFSVNFYFLFISCQKNYGLANNIKQYSDNLVSKKQFVCFLFLHHSIHNYFNCVGDKQAISDICII